MVIFYTKYRLDSRVIRYHIVDVQRRGAWNVVEISNLFEDAEEVQGISSDHSRDSTETKGILESEIAERSRGMVIRRLMPMGYYMSIIGTYVHQLFFADDEKDNGTVPDVMWSALQASIMSRKSITKSGWRIYSDGVFARGRSLNIDSVKSRLAKYYLDLNLEAEVGEEGINIDEATMLGRLLQINDELDKSIANLCGVGSPNRLRALRIDEIADLNVSENLRARRKSFGAYLIDHLDRRRIPAFD